jgi:hypothetical protein
MPASLGHHTTTQWLHRAPVRVKLIATSQRIAYRETTPSSVPKEIL